MLIVSEVMVGSKLARLWSGVIPVTLSPIWDDNSHASFVLTSMAESVARQRLTPPALKWSALCQMNTMYGAPYWRIAIQLVRNRTRAMCAHVRGLPAPDVSLMHLQTDRQDA